MESTGAGDDDVGGDLRSWLQLDSPGVVDLVPCVEDDALIKLNVRSYPEPENFSSNFTYLDI